MTDQPLVTADLPGIGGRLRERPSDFLVDELPLYEPCGTGEHLYVSVQKELMTTNDAARLLARHYGVRERDIGFAGRKDKHAITRQLFSVHLPGRSGQTLPEFSHDRMGVLWTEWHTNKLRLGHLAGNRFAIRVRGVDFTKARAAGLVLGALEQRGGANLAGDQRFGMRANNDRLGRLDVLGDAQGLLDELLGPDKSFPALQREAREAYAQGAYQESLTLWPREMRVERGVLRALAANASVEEAASSIDPTQRRFWVSALQSSVFNDVVRTRLREGLFDRLIEGDVARKRVNGAMFAVDAATAQTEELRERLRGFDVDATGPMWGPKMMRAAGKIDEMEREALDRSGVSLGSLGAHADRLRQGVAGERRAVRVPVLATSIEGGTDEHGHYVRCAFELPAGAFATVVMREIMKCDEGDAGERGATE